MSRLAGRVATLPAVLAIVWAALALFCRVPAPVPVPLAVAAAWTGGALVLLLRVRPYPRALAVVATLLAVVLGWWSTIRPALDRDWAIEYARIPTALLQGDRLTLHDVRNFDYRSETDFTPRWDDRSYDLSTITGVDLFLSHWGSPLIAHTIVSWEFADGQHLAISIETRRERGEFYSALRGFFREYELCYVAADERDVIRLRTNHRGENVFRYRIPMGWELARDLLLDYVDRMNGLARTPAFYNALTDNCTTAINLHVQHIGAAAPWDWRLLANGRVDEMLYERGMLDASVPFETLRGRASIDARARAADRDPAFSQRIRADASAS